MRSQTHMQRPSSCVAAFTVILNQQRRDSLNRSAAFVNCKCFESIEPFALVIGEMTLLETGHFIFKSVVYVKLTVFCDETGSAV